jgi:heme o synthase
VSAVAQRGVRGALRAYVALTKPRIIELLLVTTVPTMIVAERGLPSPWLVAATLLGGTLAAGSANTINSYLERDIDELMHRTVHRPLVAQQVAPGAALRFGVVLGVAAFVLLAATVNLLAAGLAVAAIGIYVFVYTIGLKRRSAQNIVIGGAAGCMPVLVGWAAVTGELALPALLLFAIVFAWTPAHFWALALRFREDYARAGVPMLPVVASARDSAVQILLYTVLLVTLTLMFGPVAGMGLIYLLAALVLGGAYIVQAAALLRDSGPERAMAAFRYSVTYLGLLFAAMAADVLIVG